MPSDILSHGKSPKLFFFRKVVKNTREFSHTKEAQDLGNRGSNKVSAVRSGEGRGRVAERGIRELVGELII